MKSIYLSVLLLSLVGCGSNNMAMHHKIKPIDSTNTGKNEGFKSTTHRVQQAINMASTSQESLKLAALNQDQPTNNSLFINGNKVAVSTFPIRIGSQVFDNSVHSWGTVTGDIVVVLHQGKKIETLPWKDVFHIKELVKSTYRLSAKSNELNIYNFYTLLRHDKNIKTVELSIFYDGLPTTKIR